MFPLETERLLLRPFTAGDFEALRAIQSRPDVARWLYWEPRDDAEVRASLKKKIEGTTLAGDGDSVSLAVVLKTSHEVIGDGVLFLLSAVHRQGEIGFVFHPDHRGHGYATETARLLLRLAFGEFGLHRVIGRLERGTRHRRASSSESGCGRKRTSWRTSTSRANGRASSSTRFWSRSGERDRRPRRPDRAWDTWRAANDDPARPNARRPVAWVVPAAVVRGTSHARMPVVVA